MKNKDLKKSFEKKMSCSDLGIRFELKEGDHHKYKVYYKGKFSLSFMISHGNSKEIGKSLQSLMAKELGLSKKDFLRLVSCPLSTEEFIEKSENIDK
ncbi:MAG: hypothetical protein OEX81_05655 [Candidatus Pacebacteria bacterium]|nr:hypothetical protein [Candidatus Paceibacterota bacterium]